MWNAQAIEHDKQCLVLINALPWWFQSASEGH